MFMKTWGFFILKTGWLRLSLDRNHVAPWITKVLLLPPRVSSSSAPA